MNLRTLVNQTRKPFENLTKTAKWLMIIRLMSSVMTVIFIAFMVGFPFVLHDLFIARLDCSHVDVANGLFAVLKQSADQNPQYGSNTLTTSEVYILSDYTSEQVAAAPQFIYSNSMNWCFGNYNYTADQSEDGDISLIDITTNVYNFQCTDTDMDYVFDYRGELSTIGLSIILVYAYGDEYIDLSSNQPQYVPDDAYLELLASRKLQNKVSRDFFFISISINFCLIISCLIYYSKRSYEKNDHKMPMVVRNIFAATSLVSFLTLFTGFLMISIQTVIIRKAVERELGSFGMSVHIGKRWIIIASFCVATTFINCLAWCGPVWWFTSRVQRLVLTENGTLEEYRDVSDPEDSESLNFKKTSGDLTESNTYFENVPMTSISKNKNKLFSFKKGKKDNNISDVETEYNIDANEYLSETPLVKDSNGVFIDQYNDEFIDFDGSNRYLFQRSMGNGDRYGNYRDMVDYSKRTGLNFADKRPSGDSELPVSDLDKTKNPDFNSVVRDLTRNSSQGSKSVHSRSQD